MDVSLFDVFQFEDTVISGDIHGVSGGNTDSHSATIGGNSDSHSSTIGGNADDAATDDAATDDAATDGAETDDAATDDAATDDATTDDAETDDTATATQEDYAVTAGDIKVNFAFQAPQETAISNMFSYTYSPFNWSIPYYNYCF
jgi:hypothetical protein